MIQVLLKVKSFFFLPFLVHNSFPLAVTEHPLLPGTVEAKVFEFDKKTH